MLKNKILSSVGGEEKLYSNDVFTSYVRTGTGADAVVNTGIDMTKGYMLWSKSRSAATGHAVYDSARGVTLDLVTNSTAAQTTQSTGLKAVSSTGHTVGSLAKMNTSGATYVDWVWKKAPKFFDVVTYTGNGVAGRQIAHGLGIAPGMIIIKRTDGVSNWCVWHSKNGDVGQAISGISLNLTNAAVETASQQQSSTTFKPSAVLDPSFTGSNTNGATYVAYLFAHDPSADGIIQCGSFTTDGSGNATVNLGWEPQYMQTKCVSTTGSWFLTDTARNWSNTDAALLYTNTSDAEAAFGGSYLLPTATGFQWKAGVLSNSQTYIYVAIRRPNKPPTTGTEVYNAIARTGTGAATTVTGVGFAPDLVMPKGRDGVLGGSVWIDKLRGKSAMLLPTSTAMEDATTTNALLEWRNDGVDLGADSSNYINSTRPFINHFFRRAPGVFSTLCYRGTGSNKTEVHDLTKAPSLMIVKSRSSANDWNVWCNGLLGTEKLVLNSTAAKVTDATAWNSTVPTSSVISLGTAAGTNTNAATYVAYLFSTLSGISKIGSYTGNGTSQTINCGFTTGARFILIKRTDSAGNWIIADSTRGILSGADPALYLNSTAAEATGVDWVDPNIVGFDIIQEGTMNANVNGASYIYLAIS